MSSVAILTLVAVLSSAAGAAEPAKAAPAKAPAAGKAKGRAEVPAEAPAVERERVVVVDFEAQAGLVPPPQQGMLERLVATALSRYRRVDAAAAVELRTMLQLEANRQAIGCSSGTCTSEIAAAIGARYTVMGRVMRQADLLELSLTLVDMNEARTLTRAAARGARLSDIVVQLPFAVDTLVEPLRDDDDPSPAEMIERARPRLAVLPVRVSAAPTGANASQKKTKQIDAIERAVDAAAKAGAPRLGLTALDVRGYEAAAKGAGCKLDDLRCALPAVATQGALLGLGVSVDVEQGSARASLLSPDGTLVARAQRRAPKLEDAIDEAVRDVIAARMSGYTPSATVAEQREADAAHGGTARAEETVVMTSPCNLVRGLLADGGTCTLTTQRLHFVPHSLNLSTAPDEIAVADVVGVEEVMTLGLVANGVRVRLKNGDTRQYAVQRKAELIDALRRGAPK